MATTLSILDHNTLKVWWVN